MENGNRQPSTSRNPPPPVPVPRPVQNYHVTVVPPTPFPLVVYIPIPSHDQVPEQGYQVMRFQLPENQNQDPRGFLRPPMVNQLPVEHGYGLSWPFIPGPGIGQPTNYPIAHLRVHCPSSDIRYLNLDAMIAFSPGGRLRGHPYTIQLINYYRQLWLKEYQEVMNQITQLQQSLIALKSRETLLFAPLKIMMEQQFSLFPQNSRDPGRVSVYQAFHDNLQNRIHNSGSSDLVRLHTQCVRTSLNCMYKFLLPGNGIALPPPGAGVWVPENPPGLHIHSRH